MPSRIRRTRRDRTRRFDHGEPIFWPNLIPLAGVLAIAAALVLSAYGVRPHAINVDMPAPPYYDDPGPLTPSVDRLVIRDNGDLLWNGTSVSDDELGSILDQLAQRRSSSGLLFTPDAGTAYARVFEVLAAIRARGLVDRCFRFSGIQRYRYYDRPETFDEPVLAQREDCPPLRQEF